MRRRGFLQLAGAAVLGVLTAKVPVFAEELPAYPLAPKGLLQLVEGPVSMWAYPTRYALPVKLKGVLRDRTITVPSLPDNFASTWVLGPARGNEMDGFDLASPNPALKAYLAEVDAIEEQERQSYSSWLRGFVV